MTIYQKVITAYEMLRSAISSRMSKYDVASDFNELSTYDEGSLVIYQDEIFICKKQHTGAWDANDFQRTTFGEAILYNIGKTEDSIMEKISDEFDDETSYSVGQIVRRNGKIYRCTSAHEGEWDSSDFNETTVSEVVNQMISELEQTAKKSELGYSGRSYDIDVSDESGWINVHDMEVAVLRLSYSGGNPSSIYIDLPEVESEDENGNFHAARCFIIVDASEIDDSEHMPDINIGSANVDVKWTSTSSGNFQTGSLNLLSLTYAGKSVWLCERQYTVPDISQTNSQNF